MATNYDVKDIGLADRGLLKIEWAGSEMPVLKLIQERFRRERPLEGLRLSACLHVTSETANLAVVLKDGGADIVLCASNPLSTQDDVAAALAGEHGIPTYAIKGEDEKTYYQHIEAALANRPNLTMDDGADLVTVLHTQKPDLLPNVVGGTEETTTGVIRLKAMANDGALKFPVIAVNEAMTAGLPVLGSVYSQAVEELCAEGETGWPFRAEEPQEMERAIDAALSATPEQLAAMRRAARARVSEWTPARAGAELLHAVRAAVDYSNGERK